MDGSVVDRVEKLFRCCVPTEQSLAQKKASPPLVVLHWGKVTSFPAFVTSVQAKYTLFTPDGTPIRATCSVSLEEMPGDPLKQNPTSGAPGRALAAHRRRRRHARVDRLRRVRRPDAVARRSRGSTGSTTRCGCAWAATLLLPARRRAAGRGGLRRDGRGPVHQRVHHHRRRHAAARRRRAAARLGRCRRQPQPARPGRPPVPGRGPGRADQARREDRLQARRHRRPAAARPRRSR